MYFLKGGNDMPPRSRVPFPPPNPHFMHPMMPRGGHPTRNRMGGGMRPHRSPQRGGGGLLAKLLGKSGRQSGGSNPFSAFPARAAGRAATGPSGSGGLLKTLTDPNALNGLLTNTQKVLNTAGQIGPVIQQYGPLVRNLPSLWRLYKGFKDLPSESEESPSENDKTALKTNKSTPKNTKVKSELKTPERSQTRTGQSTPKLYI